VEECLDVLQEKVTPEMNEQLTSRCTSEEVCTAISQMAPYKSPGPDGFPPCFYHKYWPLIGKEVCQAVIFAYSRVEPLILLMEPILYSSLRKSHPLGSLILGPLACVMCFIR
jgi:hypothetical protein